MLKAPKIDTSVAQAPPVAPVVAQADTRPKKKPMAPTFLGSEATPQQTAMGGGTGRGLTLLGQA